MRAGRICALLVLVWTASPAFAGDDLFSVGRCQGLAPAVQERLRAIDASLTAEAAGSAETEVRRRLRTPLTEPARPGAAPGALAAAIEGWMIKREWLAARARHEHDADEAAACCGYLRRAAGLDE